LKFTFEIPRRYYDQITGEAKRKGNPGDKPIDETVNDIILVCVNLALPWIREMGLAEFLSHCHSVRGLLEAEAI